MKLNINSNTAQLYRWFYGTVKMPDSLCPYFWKLVLMWLLIVPYSILSLPVIIIERLDRSRCHSTGERAGMGFILWFITFMLICMITLIAPIFIGLPTKDTLYMQLFATGTIGWLFAITIGIYQGIQYLKRKWERRNIKYDANGYRIWDEPVEKQPNIIVEFVKASYNKYCPKIDWKHSTK